MKDVSYAKLPIGCFQLALNELTALELYPVISLKRKTYAVPPVDPVRVSFIQPHLLDHPLGSEMCTQNKVAQGVFCWFPHALSH